MNNPVLLTLGSPFLSVGVKVNEPAPSMENDHLSDQLDSCGFFVLVRKHDQTESK